MKVKMKVTLEKEFKDGFSEKKWKDIVKAIKKEPERLILYHDCEITVDSCEITIQYGEIE